MAALNSYLELFESGFQSVVVPQLWPTFAIPPIIGDLFLCCEYQGFAVMVANALAFLNIDFDREMKVNST